MFLSHTEYAHAIDLLDEKIEPSPLFNELADWMKLEFDVQIYDYFCDYIESGQIRLKIILWNNSMQRQFRKGANYDSKKQKKIQIKFAELARKYYVHPEYHAEKDIFVCFDTICDQIACKLLGEKRNEIYALQKDYIWKIVIDYVTVSIFYETDVQVEQFKLNGVSDELRKNITQIVIADDKYNVFSNGIFFDFTSHQTLNEKYRGNLFFYHNR